jgi:hypothetical protein
LLIRNHLAIRCLSTGCQLIVALPLLSSPKNLRRRAPPLCAAVILLYAAKSPQEEKDLDNEGKDNLQPNPSMMILILFDVRCSCAVVIVAVEAVVKISLALPSLVLIRSPQASQRGGP